MDKSKKVTATVEPNIIQRLAQKLDEQSSGVVDKLQAARRERNKAKKLVEEWDKTLEVAHKKLADRKKSDGLSEAAESMAKKLIQDAEDRKKFIKENILDPLHAEVAKYREANASMEKLRTRLELQNFRESFHLQALTPQGDHSAPEPVSTMSSDELRAIEREIRTLAHSLDALKEIQAA